MLSLIAAISLHALSAPAHAGWLLGQTDELPPPPPPPVVQTPDEPPPPPPPVVQAPAPAPSPAPQGVSPPRARMPAQEREAVIRALRSELKELEEEKAGVGYVAPILFVGVGVGGILVGTLWHSGIPTLNTVLLVAGTTIAALSTLWFLIRVVKGVSLGNQISGKEQELRELEAQRFQLGFMLLPGAGAASLTVRL
ncbi:MAG: hypothetical protein IPJ65_06930 [Archangiaceae bacterium]|nr:hypothetical protein [Archangiaceae bacterium]